MHTNHALSRHVLVCKYMYTFGRNTQTFTCIMCTHTQRHTYKHDRQMYSHILYCQSQPHTNKSAPVVSCWPDKSILCTCEQMSLEVVSLVFVQLVLLQVFASLLRTAADTLGMMHRVCALLKEKDLLGCQSHFLFPFCLWFNFFQRMEVAVE